MNVMERLQLDRLTAGIAGVLALQLPAGTTLDHLMPNSFGKLSSAGVSETLIPETGF